MNLKNKLKITRLPATIIVLVCVAMVGLTFQGCEKDELFMENSVEENVLQLANKYGLSISINDAKDKNATELESFEELDLLFQTLVNERKKKISKEFEVKNMKDGYIIAKTIDDSKFVSLNRLKRGSVESNGTSLSSWFYDLTWFNVAITYNKNGSIISNVSINSYYSGVSLYDYTQLSSSRGINGSIINFSIQGKESNTYSIMGIGFTESRSIEASGNFNTDTGTGTINLSGNGYWFQG